jgi:1,6-anhydro-N-acetylmuramate kinase
MTMAIVQDKSFNNSIDQKLCSPNRTAANLAGVIALTPLYPGEIVLALDTGQRFRGLSLVAGMWGMVSEDNTGP